MRRKGRVVRAWRAMALAAGLAGAGGCTDAVVELRVARDGGGEIRLRVLMPPDARRRVRQVAEVVDQLGLSAQTPLGAFASLVARYPEEDPAEVFARPEVLAEMARSFGPGVAPASARRIRRGEERGFDATFRFPDVRGLRLPYVQGAERERSGALCFDFVPGSAPLLKAFVEPVAQRKGEGGGGSIWSSRAVGWLGGVTGWYRALEELFDGLRVRFDILGPGPVLRTNASYPVGPSAVRMLRLDGSAMEGAELQALLLVDRFGELADFRARNPAGVQVEDPAKVVVIRFR